MEPEAQDQVPAVAASPFRLAVSLDRADSFVKQQPDIGGVITNLQPVSVAAQLNSPTQRGAMSEAVS